MKRRIRAYLGYGAGLALRKFAFTLILLWPSFVSAEALRVSFLGDSLVQGYGLAPEQGLVPKLQSWLRQAGVEVEMINAGVSGDTTSGGLARIAWTLSDKPDALLVALGGNDVLRGLDPGLAEQNLAGILEAAAQAEVPAMLFGFDAPSNYGPEYETAFEGLYGSLAKQFDVDLHPGFWVAFQGLGAQELQTWLQGDMIHPNVRGVEKIVDLIGPSIQDFLQKQAGP
ncbi:MAG: arylesterase [Pseudomonadota bacterium]